MQLQTDNDLALAIQLTVKLASQYEVPTREQIEGAAARVLEMLHLGGQALQVARELLVREVEARCSVFVPAGTVLQDQDPHGHQEWLSNRRGEIAWRFWERYRRWLEDYQGLEPLAARRLDETTNHVLRLLEDPKRTGAWDRRGMVVGHVQAGKTSNYIGLICKAADAGYRLVVVLTGMHDSLRAQTQLRLDQGFLGFDTQRRMFERKTVLLGVGEMPATPIYTVHVLTNSAQNGDFKLPVASQANVMLGGADPILLVVKKNKSILANLLKWATFLREQQDGGARSVVRGVPLLVIDDEADNASVDTSRTRRGPNPNAASEDDPTAINGLIRRLLLSFEQSAYVGYTATPFANILIFKDAVSEEYGHDLFPRSFIVRLRPPTTYFGPLTVFGCGEDALAGLEAQPGLPIVRVVDDYSQWVRDRHRGDWQTGPIPDSLKEALRAFVLVCAARAARGQDQVHNSMLVHVTRFQAVQEQVSRDVREEVEYLQQRLKRGDGAAPAQLVDELHALWNRDFVPSAREMNSDLPDWKDVANHLYRSASKIEIRVINGTAKDALEYFEHPGGLNVIAIGGNKLSRGLTLEGLSVSYFLRASKMYDTLMQMGRWFGYRRGYQDLCRLYTTQELRDWYRDISVANEELLGLFDEMADRDETPERFGLRIRSHPDGLMVTAAAKMRHGEKMSLSFAGTIPETLVIDMNPASLRNNLEATTDLLYALGRWTRREADTTGTYLWEGVSPDRILEFLLRYRPYEKASKVQPGPLMRYIESRVADGELVQWTVALVSVRGGRQATVGECEVSLVQRQPDDETALTFGRYVMRRLISPADEAIDLTRELRAEALRLTQERWETNRGRSRRQTPPAVAAGGIIRELRPAMNGLLLLYPLDPTQAKGSATDDPIIGYAISFPGSDRAQPVEYVVNNVYYQQEQGFDGD
jgi:hypothetical protein